MNRVNKLANEPEFYHTITNNCTTNLAGHVNTVADNKIIYNWKVLLPGFSDVYAYELGLLPSNIPFEDLRSLAYVNDLAEEHYEAKNFSQLIRSRRPLIDRMAKRQTQRDPLISGSGDEYLLRETRTRWR